MLGLCWPDPTKFTEEQKKSWSMVVNELEKNVVFRQFVNIQVAYRAVLFSMLSALFLCIIYIYFMSIFAEYVAWGIIAVTQITFVVMAFGSFYYMFSSDVSSEAKKAAVVGAIIFSLLSVCFCMCLYCFWSSLKIAIEIINCSADFLAATKRVLFTPIIYYVIMFGFIMFWLGCVISVESMGKIKAAPKEGKLYIPFQKKIVWDEGDDTSLGKRVNYMLAFLVFSLIWFTFFLQASSNYVIMVTATTYYFTSTSEEDGSGEMATGFRWAWINNFGSLAFGSLIIAIIFTIRVCVYYVLKKIEDANPENGFIKAVSCIANCCLKCL